MSHGHVRLLVFACLAATDAAATDAAAPEESFLEFLATWSGEDGEGELFEFLENLAGEPREAPVSDAPDEPTTGHDTP